MKRRSIWVHGAMVLGMLLQLTAAIPAKAAEGGSIVGKTTFDGSVPRLRPLPMDADPACASMHSEPVFPEIVVVNDEGEMQNVFVYVKSGLEGQTFPTPQEPVDLVQEGCVYKPHVVGIQVHQNLRVLTSDNTTHNVHPLPQVNTEWNLSQAAGAAPIVRQFDEAEIRIPVVCNQHPWMRAVVNVVSNPYYAVSDEDGNFEIAGLPPGEYEIEAVHERYGAMVQKVTVTEGGQATADFAFEDSRASQPSSLRLMPALVLP